MTRFLLLFLLAGILPTTVVGQPSTEGRIWLVAVGIGNYQHASWLSNLDFTVPGTYDFVRLFEQRQLVEMDGPLVGPKAKKSAILAAMRSTFINNPNIRPEDMIIFYFSGHGEIAGGQEGICPYDYNPKDVRGLIANEEIQQIMGESPARHKICFIEACKTEVQTQRILDPTYLKSFNQARRRISGGLVFITSTESGMPSIGDPKTIGGYFTHFLLEGLKGKANTDNDAYITVNELFRYVEREVSNYTNGAQVPQINDLGGYDGKLPLIILPEELPLPAEEPAEYYPPGFEYLRDQMVAIPGGRFQMGSNEGEANEKPVHPVTISPFYLSKYEVTVREFSKFIVDANYQTDAEKEGYSWVWNGADWEKKEGANWQCGTDGSPRPSRDWDHPVIHVSWNDAVAYCQWLSEKTGKTFRLPSEAEWEYAAGNGSRHTKYSWGNGEPSGKNGGSVADETGAKTYNWTRSKENIFLNYDDGYANTAPVGRFNPNELGLYDMTGNVWEWCEDVWHDSYVGAPTNGTAWTSGGESARRVVRGGSWYDFPDYCRVALRYGDGASDRFSNTGFRLAR